VDEASAIRTNIRTHSPGVSGCVVSLLRFGVNEPHTVSTVWGNIHHLTQGRPHNLGLNAGIKCFHGAAVSKRANDDVRRHRVGHDLTELV
jgi:hypothetical protein